MQGRVFQSDYFPEDPVFADHRNFSNSVFFHSPILFAVAIVKMLCDDLKVFVVTKSF